MPVFFKHPHEDHHTQEQEDDVQVDGAHGVFKGEDKIRTCQRSPRVYVMNRMRAAPSRAARVRCIHSKEMIT